MHLKHIYREYPIYEREGIFYIYDPDGEGIFLWDTDSLSEAKDWVDAEGVWE
jgi:hypothetical protein